VTLEKRFVWISGSPFFWAINGSYIELFQPAWKWKLHARLQMFRLGGYITARASRPIYFHRVGTEAKKG